MKHTIEMPPYTVARKRKTGTAYYFVVPKHLRPHGWLPTIPLGNDRDDGLKAISDAGWAKYELLKQERRVDQLGIQKKAVKGSLADVVDLYKESERWEHLKPATQDGYESFLKTIITWSRLAGYPHISSYEPKHIAKFLAKWKGKQRSRRFYKAVLSILFDVAVDEGLISNNFVKNMSLPRDTSEKKKLVVWEESDVLKWVAKADEMGYPNAGTAVLIAFDMGQRQTDIFNFQEPRDYNAGKFIFKTSKTGKRISIRASDRIVGRLEKRPVTQLMLTIHDVTKLQWDRFTFNDIFREISDACGMKDYTFRQLRNSAAIHCERADLTDAEFEAIFGWPKENVRHMLTEYYADRDQEVADRGIEKLENYRKTKASS